MNRFILGLGCISLIGLIVVAGEVEIVKTGYDIRRLNLKKHALRHDVNKREYHLANLKTPQKLESAGIHI